MAEGAHKCESAWDHESYNASLFVYMTCSPMRFLTVPLKPFLFIFITVFLFTLKSYPDLTRPVFP